MMPSAGRGRWGVVGAVAFVYLLSVAGVGVEGDGPVDERTTAAAGPSFAEPVSPSPSQDPPELSRVDVELTRLFTVDGEPTVLVPRPGDDALYLGTKDGRVHAYRDGRLVPDPVLDLRSAVESSGVEQGLLGAAFSPDGGTLYVNFTDPDGDTRVQALRFVNDAPDAEDAVDVLEIEQPFAEHNGGGMVFGPDGYLWISVGDGGNRAEVAPNAQRLDVLLGKILRIEPTPGARRPYRIPDSNPFVERAGRDEIWAYGLRHPFRFSFDRATGDLWIADVGQSSHEELNLERAPLTGGWNYGWPIFEGVHRVAEGSPVAYVPPVFEYGRPAGLGRCAVTGGYVYRGPRIPPLRGAYVFADFCAGRLQALAMVDGRVIGHRFLDVPPVRQVTSFAEGKDGELYVLQGSGQVFRIDPAGGDERPGPPLSRLSRPR